MNYVKCEQENRCLVISMVRGKANPMNPELVHDLAEAFNQAAISGDISSVVVMGGSPGFFSAGFDVKEVFAMDREEMREFFGRFINLYERVLRFEKPVVAAVTGHAFAGGAVLALACDARIFARGKFGFALNELNLGIVLPPGMIRLATGAVGPKVGREIVLGAKTFTPEEALEGGIANSLADAADVRGEAIKLAEQMGEKPPLAYAALKRLFLQAAGHHPTGNDREWLPEFLEYWFAEESRILRKALTDSIKS